MTTVVLTGPESCGKTTLARILAESFAAGLVAEQARDYLDQKDLVGRYQPSDLLKIAERQSAAEAHASFEQKITVCDTDHQVVSIWWSERFGPVPNNLSERYKTDSSRFYLLCRPDLPWQIDAQRENAKDRKRLYRIYRTDLVDRNLQFAEVEGLDHKRTAQAIASVRSFLSAVWR